ncbi:MAG: hydantoinase/oxoprolinase family protein, partial [Pseudomonadota bacterium]|nr:hydantoinase/oxoprolinase family protein [Pseudomonadota bacterium]
THGTTVGTNAILQKRGARVGLITTKGHNDVIYIMRGSRGLTGRDLDKVVHFPESSKPEPLISKKLIRGVSERVDCFGHVVVDLNEREAEQAVDELLALGVEAIAVCFLWSFKHPAHEMRIREIVRAKSPDVFVTLSSDLVPKWGEYERTTAVALNAYIGPVTSSYLRELDVELNDYGYQHPLQITQCGGGTISVNRAIEAPLLTLDSGPVSGVIGSQFLSELMGYNNVITTDMGGTSFDVGIISDGEPAFTYVSNVNQYEYFLPKIDIQAVGNGGGSLVRVDPTTGVLRVGPESAGAVPGPICYDQGGEIPTVTDAALVLGYIAVDSFANGTIQLNRANAEDAIAKIGEQLGLDLMETAAGIVKISEFQMADLIRRMTIQKGFDPRDFVLFAFGGAGPMHAGVFAFELGVQKVIVPQGNIASTWCGFGAASADILHIVEQVDIMLSPFNAAALNERFDSLRQRVNEQFAEDGVPTDQQQLQISLDMRHKGQINEVEVVITTPLSDRDVETLHAQFLERYELIYGKGASLPWAKLEAVTFRIRAFAKTPKPDLVPQEISGSQVEPVAQVSVRPIYWSEPKLTVETPIYSGAKLMSGNQICGPAVIETTDTTLVVHPGRQVDVDTFGNFVLSLS